MRIKVVQPTVPTYRVEFFRRLVATLDGELTLLAAPTFLGGPDSVKVTELPEVDFRPSHPVRSLFKARLLWQSELDVNEMQNGDVLVISGNPRFLSNYPLIFQARCKRIGIVWWGHGHSSSSGWLGGKIRAQLMKLADVCLLYTEQEKEQFERRSSWKGRIFATNNSVGTEKILAARGQWADLELQKFRTNYFEPNQTTLLFCGRLTPKAQLDILLNALPEIIARRPNVRLIVIGDGELLQAHQNLAVGLGVNHCVTWLGSLYEENDLAPWFLSADVFVYPGAVGLSLLHAFNYALPVVTHDNLRKHNPEIAALIPGTNGMTFREGSSCDLVSVLEQLLVDKPLLQMMSRNAQQLVLTKFSTQSMVNGFTDAVAKARQLALSKST